MADSNEIPEEIMQLTDTSDFGNHRDIDIILDSQYIDGKKYYLIKWRNHPMKFNSWEPAGRLKRFRYLIEYYESIRNCETIVNEKLAEYFLYDITYREPCDILALIKLGALLSGCSEKYVNSLELTAKQLKEKAQEIKGYSSTKLSKISEKLLNIMQLFEARKSVLVRLKEWELHINDFNPSIYIEVENNVDLDGSPPDFHYIHDYINFTIDIPSEVPVTFCHCDDCYQNRKLCCPLDSEGLFPYNKYGILVLPPGYPIFECNKNCKCGIDCTNRVVQRGQTVKLAIFRTDYGCGWGLKTLENIKKGQFVLEYLGEIITSETAEERGKLYDHTGRTYLFDLDYGMEPVTFTVDSTVLGNVARFINHSCNPNLNAYAVFINQQDPRLPRLAFFASRKIKRGEEITFNYKMENNYGYLSTKCEATEDERVLCKCNSENCRKYLF